MKCLPNESDIINCDSKNVMEVSVAMVLIMMRWFCVVVVVVAVMIIIVFLVLEH